VHDNVRDRLAARSGADAEVVVTPGAAQAADRLGRRGLSLRSRTDEQSHRHVAVTHADAICSVRAAHEA
jgi:hypothetical protein